MFKLDNYELLLNEGSSSDPQSAVQGCTSAPNRRKKALSMDTCKEYLL